MQRHVCALSIAVCFFVGSGCEASQKKLLEKQAGEQLSADDWKVREKAMSTLIAIDDEGYKLGKETRKQIVALLNRETQAFSVFENKLRTEGKTANQCIAERGKQFPTGEYDDYIKIISHYLAVRKVEGSLPVVFQLIAQTNYAVTPAILISYGSKHLDFFIEKAVTGAEKERLLTLNVLSIWLDTSVEGDDFDTRGMPSLDESERKLVRPVLVKAAGDSDYNVRSAALSGLEEYVSDADVGVLVEKMAGSDPEQFIRKEAREILNKHR